MTEWDCSDYSIPELEEALGTVDARRYPENKAALERELAARKASGEYARFLETGHKKEKQKRTYKIHFARRMRTLIAVYLMVSAVVFAVAVSFGEFPPDQQALWMTAFFLLAGASLSAGVGLLLRKTWAHWTAVFVLGLQATRFQVGGVLFSPPSLLSLDLSAGGDGIGFNAELDAGFQFAVGVDGPILITVNALAITLIGYLFTARQRAPESSLDA